MPLRLTLPLLLVFLAALSGCTLVGTGARSAVVVLRSEAVAADASFQAPSREEIKSALSQRHLWLVDDRRAVQWIAYIDVRPPPTPLQPFGLTIVEVQKNPAWDPRAVSTPISDRDVPRSGALDLAEQGQQRERGQVSSAK